MQTKYKAKPTIDRLACWAALGALALAGSAQGQDEGFAFPPARVEVAAAELRDMAPSVDVSGTVVSLNDSRIAS